MSDRDERLRDIRQRLDRWDHEGHSWTPETRPWPSFNATLVDIRFLLSEVDRLERDLARRNAHVGDDEREAKPA